MEPIAYVNGAFLPLEEAVVHIEDRGFQFADGVYDVVVCLNGHFLDLQPHLERLQRSCEAIGITLPYSLEYFGKLVEELYANNSFDDAMIYIQVTRGVAPRSHLINGILKPTVVMTVRQLPGPSEKKIEEGFSAITLTDFRWGRCDIKSIALLASVMGKHQAASAGADEAFWLDEEEHVLEGCSTNVFAVIDGALVTHPLDHRILGGIMRDMVLRIAEDEGISIQQRSWSLDEADLSECMMSSTTNALLPVCTVNGKPIGNSLPGPVAVRLRKLVLAELESIRNQ